MCLVCLLVGLGLCKIIFFCFKKCKECVIVVLFFRLDMVRFCWWILFCWNKLVNIFMCGLIKFCFFLFNCWCMLLVIKWLSWIVSYSRGLMELLLGKIGVDNLVVNVILIFFVDIGWIEGEKINEWFKIINWLISEWLIGLWKWCFFEY